MISFTASDKLGTTDDVYNIVYVLMVIDTSAGPCLALAQVWRNQREIQGGFFKKEAKRGQHHYFQIVYRS